MKFRGVSRHWVTTVFAGLVLFFSVGMAIAAFQERDFVGFVEVVVYLYGFLALGCAVWAGVLIARRRSQTVRSTHVLGVLQVLVPIGPAMGFALPRYIRTQPEKKALLASVAYGLSLILVMARDLYGQTSNSSMVRNFLGTDFELGEAVDVTPTGLMTVYLLTLLIPVGLGYYQRSRATLAGAEETIEVQERAAEDMSDQLSRKEEREMIAREVHDKIGHKLSLVTLYSGALEMGGEDEELNDQLRLVRKSAQEAVDDLQDLVQIMRDPSNAGFTPESHSLSDLADVIDNILGAGHLISSSVLINNPADAPDLLTSSTYRIIQELLTNSIKHAPDQPVRVKVTGGPGEGISISVSNRLQDADNGVSASSRVGGLTGISERAEAVGGWSQVSRGDKEFLVRVWMPWETAKSR